MHQGSDGAGIARCSATPECIVIVSRPADAAISAISTPKPIDHARANAHGCATRYTAGHLVKPPHFAVYSAISRSASPGLSGGNPEHLRECSCLRRRASMDSGLRQASLSVAAISSNHLGCTRGGRGKRKSGAPPWEADLGTPASSSTGNGLLPFDGSANPMQEVRNTSQRPICV